jgi:hypothetical protein
MTNKFFKLIGKEIQPEPADDDLYEILPRFVGGNIHSTKGLALEPIRREFAWEGEEFQLFITPAALEDENGQYNHYFPGPQEAQIETALIEFAAQDKDSSFDGDKKFSFMLSQFQNHLAGSNQHFSAKQIELSIGILAGAAYIVIGKDVKWIFRTIETLAMVEEKSDVRFLAYFGDVIVERIKKYKLN